MKSPFRQKVCGKLPATFRLLFASQKAVKSLPQYAPEQHKVGQSGRVALPLVVACVLGLALLARIGVPLWNSVAPAPEAGPAGPDAATADGQHRPDLAAMQALALFDSASTPVSDPAPGATAVNTTLDLRLEGVILAGEGGASLAVIVSGNQQASYRTGDTLPVGTNIVVDSIARDHVVIDNRGQSEVLWLFGGEAAAPVTAGTTQGAITLPPGAEEHVLQTAARLAEIITVEPAVENARVIGYRLTPGARLKDFVQLGFRTNDIVTAVNGIALDNPANLPKLYGLMDGATEVSFSLLRDGAPLSLNVRLDPEPPNHN